MYVEGHQYKDAALVVCNMIDVWRKNGIVLLNVFPRANGVINQEQRDILNPQYALEILLHIEITLKQDTSLHHFNSPERCSRK